MTTNSPQKQHLDFIDGLRGVAILLVMINHWSFYVRAGVPVQGLFQEILRGGHFGVTLFFLVSAYTLFSSSFRRFHEEATPYRNFYIRRAFRILPLWWLATSFYVLFRHHSPVDHAPHYFMYYMFAKAPFLFGGEWSLFVEESFYLFLPLLFPLAGSVRGALVLLLLTVVARGAGFYFGFSALMPWAHWYCFALGLLLLHAHRAFPQSHGPRWRAELTAVAVLAVLAWSLRADWGKGDVGTALCLAAFFWIARDPATFVGRAMRVRWLRQFGICCYSLYLFHVAIIEWVYLPIQQSIAGSTFWGTLPVGAQILVSFPFFAAFSLGVCTLCFRFLEQPSIRVGKKLISLLNQKMVSVTG